MKFLPMIIIKAGGTSESLGCQREKLHGEGLAYFFNNELPTKIIILKNLFSNSLLYTFQTLCLHDFVFLEKVT